MCVLSIIAFSALNKDKKITTETIRPTISAGCYSIMLEDSYIFFTTDSSATFYRQYFDGRMISLGSIDDFAFNLGFHTLIDQKLYFYITTADSIEAVFENNSFVNRIYCIDIDKNLLREIYFESECLPGAIISSIDNYLISRQSQRSEDNFLYTYIEIYDTSINQIVKTSEVFTLNDNTNVGTYMMNMCCDGNYIYALLDERYEDGSNSPFIVKYDTNFEIQEVINIDSIAEYILTARVGEMYIDDTFLFMRNYSADACVSRIENGNVIPIIQENGLRKSLQYTTGQRPIFYVFGSTRIYLFDESKGSYVSHELNLQNDYIIQSIMVNDHTALVALFVYPSAPDDDLDERLILVDVPDITKRIFP